MKFPESATSIKIFLNREVFLVWKFVEPFKILSFKLLVVY